MKRLLLPLLAALSLPSGIKAEEPYYSNKEKYPVEDSKVSITKLVNA